MATTEDTPNSEDDHEVPHALAERVKRIDEGDLLQFNDDRRTWDVTDVVTETFDDTDSRDSQCAVRLHYNPTRETPQVVGLILDRYPGHAEVSLNFLQSDRLGEEGTVVSLEELELFDIELEWVVVQGGNPARKWHRPDPDAALRGEAEPVCPRAPTESDFRFVQWNLIKSHYEPCKTCMTEYVPDSGLQ